MGVKLMTGATGEQNIRAADDRECLAGITGLDSYVFPTGSRLKAMLVDANTVSIGTGAGSLQGSRFRCSTTTTVNIQSGTQGQFRHDIVGLHFSRETSGRESLEFRVLTGKPAPSEGKAADPVYTAGDLLKGDTEAFMPLYRVKLSGINATGPEPMFSVLTPLATLGDFVFQNEYPKVICGSVVRDAKNYNAVMLFDDGQFREIAGRAFDNTKDYISAMNADGNASGAVVTGILYDPRTKHLDAHLSGLTGAVRLNYIITLGA